MTVAVAPETRVFRALGVFTRRSGDTMLLESYRDSYELNATAAYLWSLIGAGVTVESVITRAAATYGLAPSDAGRHVCAFVQDLVRGGFAYIES